MKSHASLLLSAAILLANSGLLYSAETKPEPVPEVSQRHWELQIVDGVLLKHNNTRSPATLQNVVDYLVGLYPANVVLAPTLGNIQIGNLKLAGFKWESALEALRIASGSQFICTSRGSAPGIDPTTGMPLSQTSRDEADLYVLEPDPAGPHRASGRAVEVFNLAGHLQGKDSMQAAEALKEVQTILAESLEQVQANGGFVESEPNPSIRFHERASLLVLVGTPQQIDVARKIILALPGTTASQTETGMAYGTGAMMGGGGFGGGMSEVMARRYGLRPRNVPNVPQAEEDGSFHTIRAGDTLEGIARLYGTRVDALQGANPGLDSLRVGQTLRIPGKGLGRPGTESGGIGVSTQAPGPAGHPAVAPPAPGR